jgi:type VI secretion system protein ImpK
VRRSALSWLPLWVTAAVAALVLTGVYLLMSFQLSGASDPVYARIQGLRLTPPTPAVKQLAPKPRLAQFLQSEIKAELVAVRDEVDRSVVTIRGDGLFAAGSAALVAEREALLGRIGDSLAQLGGNVLVTGHTDSQPIRSARFPSNWHLSEERAKSVRELLIGRKVAPERLRAEGRADGEPLAANDTPANRALNRRVEVTLFVPRTDAPVAPAAPAAPAASKP